MNPILSMPPMHRPVCIGQLVDSRSTHGRQSVDSQSTHWQSANCRRCVGSLSVICRWCVCDLFSRLQAVPLSDSWAEIERGEWASGSELGSLALCARSTIRKRDCSQSTCSLKSKYCDGRVSFFFCYIFHVQGSASTGKHTVCRLASSEKKTDKKPSPEQHSKATGGKKTALFTSETRTIIWGLQARAVQVWNCINNIWAVFNFKPHVKMKRGWELLIVGSHQLSSSDGQTRENSQRLSRKFEQVKKKNKKKLDESARESLRVHQSFRPNESLNSQQLSSLFGPGLILVQSTNATKMYEGLQEWRSNIVSTLDLRSGRREFGKWQCPCVVYLGKTLYSHSASIHPGV